jgi:aromatic-L-amino-acid decarboxylase
LVAPVTLNIVCFRYINPEVDDAGLDVINQQIVEELQEQGLAVVSGTRVGGDFVMHVGITNHRSRRDDFDFLAREVVRLGNALTQPGTAGELTAGSVPEAGE